MKLNLKSLALTSKTAEFAFPGIPGFKVSLTYLSREAKRKLEDANKVQKIDESSGLPYMDLDIDSYTRAYVEATLSGWTGLTLGNVSSLMLIDESLVDDPDALIDFDLDTAIQLVKLSERFDAWVTERLTHLNNFRG